MRITLKGGSSQALIGLAGLILGFVGAGGIGGIGFQLLTAMNLSHYRTVSMLLVATS